MTQSGAAGEIAIIKDQWP